METRFVTSIHVNLSMQFVWKLKFLSKLFFVLIKYGDSKYIISFVMKVYSFLSNLSFLFSFNLIKSREKNSSCEISFVVFVV